uniref:RNA-dependent RNA polymerase n=1 Tax=Hubei noda-like virus 1 TaxID=1922965 RepID=A0A1L3KG66_9VIRU|nr:hypothetical protein [Hubei noda-like virus 1]
MVDIDGREYPEHSADHICHPVYELNHDTTSVQDRAHRHHFVQCPIATDPNNHPIMIDVDYYHGVNALCALPRFTALTRLPIRTPTNTITLNADGTITYRSTESSIPVYTHQVWDHLADGERVRLARPRYFWQPSYLYKRTILHCDMNTGTLVVSYSRCARTINWYKYAHRLISQTPWLAVTRYILTHAPHTTVRELFVSWKRPLQIREHNVDRTPLLSRVTVITKGTIRTALVGRHLTVSCDRGTETYTPSDVSRIISYGPEVTLYGVQSSGIGKDIRLTQYLSKSGVFTQVATLYGVGDGPTKPAPKPETIARQLYDPTVDGLPVVVVPKEKQKALRACLLRNPVFQARGARRLSTVPYAKHFLCHVKATPKVNAVLKTITISDIDSVHAEKCYARQYTAPLSNAEALFPLKGLGNTLAMLVGRVIDPQTRSRRTFNRRVLQVLDRELPKLLKDTVCIEMEAYLNTQKRSAKDRLLKEDLGPETRKCFIKVEPYGKPNDPRNITTLPDHMRIPLGIAERSLCFANKSVNGYNSEVRGISQTYAGSAYGMNHDEIEVALNQLWDKYPHLYGVDLSRADGSVHPAILDNFYRHVSKAFPHISREVFMKQVQYKSRSGQVSWTLHEGGAIQSGSPFTSGFWNLLMPIVWRDVLGEAEDFLCMSDDNVVGAVARPTPERLEEIFNKLGEWGFKATLESRDLSWTTTAVSFLGRLWIRSPNSDRLLHGQDLSRTLPKLTLAWEKPEHCTVAEAVMDKVTGYMATDCNTPVIGDILRALESCYGWAAPFNAHYDPSPSTVYRLLAAGTNTQLWDKHATDAYLSYYEAELPDGYFQSLRSWNPEDVNSRPPIVTFARARPWEDMEVNDSVVFEIFRGC